MRKFLRRILIVILCLWVYQTYFRYVINYSGSTVFVMDRLTGKGYELPNLAGLFPYPYSSQKHRKPLSGFEYFGPQ